MESVPGICADAPARVLVVEDEALIRLLVADALRDAGFAVVEAARADEALTYIEAGGQVDLVFTDVHMPGFVNGLDLARQLRARFPSLPVIITSGNLGPHLPDPPGVFIPKPYDPHRVLAVVCETLGLDPSGRPDV